MSSSALINSIIESNGGLSRWSQLSCVDVEFDLTGAILALKRRPTHFSPRVSVSTTEQRVSYSGLGGPPGESWVFTPSKVYKQSAEGTILDSRENPRAAFEGHTMETPWDDFHHLYFLGCALWQYINFPYLLAREDVVAREVEAHREIGETWRVLEVTFPDPFVFASHNQVQRYYFNDRFELVRHDYAPDVVAGAPAAHYSVDNVVVGGLKFPTMRRVVSKDQEGKPMHNGPIPTLISVIFSKIELKDIEGKSVPDGLWALTKAPAA